MPVNAPKITEQGIPDGYGGFTRLVMEKAGGEGSRGGKIIGHTKSGKPIYDHHEGGVAGFHAAHANWKAQDHEDAAKAHASEAQKPRGGGNEWSSAEEGRYHSAMGAAHRVAQAQKLGHAMTDDDDAHLGGYLKRASDERQPLEKASGEGSRGGKVIGHTRSGKPIYEHELAEHPSVHGHRLSDTHGAWERTTIFGQKKMPAGMVESMEREHALVHAHPDADSVDRAAADHTMARVEEERKAYDANQAKRTAQASGGDDRQHEQRQADREGTRGRLVHGRSQGLDAAGSPRRRRGARTGGGTPPPDRPGHHDPGRARRARRDGGSARRGREQDGARQARAR
jgi:hypothetical protein